MRFSTDDELANWNRLVLESPNNGDILQSRQFADLKKSAGWTPRYLTSKVGASLALEKSIPLLGTYWYIPKGPGVSSSEQLTEFVAEIKPIAAKNGVFAVTIEPELTDTSLIASLGLVPVYQIQPNISTVIIDLTPDEENILGSFSQTARRMIRKAEKEPGIRIEAVATSDANCQIMYDLYRETAENHFSIHEYEYHRQYWQAYAADGLGQLFFAYHDGHVVAAVFAIIFGSKALYKDGASVRAKTAPGISHLLQWEVMRWLKSHGCTTYDLHGTPHSTKLEDMAHSFYGIGRFKTSFSKEIIDYVGALDIPVSRWRTTLWHNLVKKIIMRLYRHKHGHSWY